MFNKKSVAIARWEFKEKVRKKSFLIFSIFFPLLVIAISLISASFNSETRVKPNYMVGIFNIQDGEFRLIDRMNTLGLYDGTEKFIFLQMDKKPDNQDSKLWIGNKLQSGMIDLAIDYNNKGENRKEVYFEPGISPDVLLDLQNYLSQIDLTLKSQADPNLQLLKLMPTEIISEKLSLSFQKFYYSLSLLVLLAFITLFSGGTFVRSMLYERSNGLIELYFSSCTGKEIVSGKLMGLIAVGLFQVIIWLLFGILTVSTFDFPYTIIQNFLVQLLFFILGYTFYSTIFLSAGAFITNEYEAQQVTSILSIVLIVPIMLSVNILQSPESFISQVLSYFPLTLAPLVILRANMINYSFLELLAYSFELIVSIYIMILMASYFYRASVLISSKKISLTKIKSFLKD